MTLSTPKPLVKREKMYQVHFSNYYPREVDSTWGTLEEATKRVDELSGEKGNDWRVEEIIIGGTK